MEDGIAFFYQNNDPSCRKLKKQLQRQDYQQLTIMGESKFSRRKFLTTGALVKSAMSWGAIADHVKAETINSSKPLNGTEMARRKLGSGEHQIEVSALGLGCMGMSYHRSFIPDQKTMLDLLRKAPDLGMNFFDTAEAYGPYTNETFAYRTWSDPSGNPAMKGPWAKLSALNLSTGEYEWQVPLGNDENLQEDGGPPTGLLGRSGPMVTAGGLVFISGAADKKLWAFDKKTGDLVWETTLPAANNANVCSYFVEGK